MTTSVPTFATCAPELPMTASLLCPGRTRLAVPPFTLEKATHTVRLIEDVWNGRDPDRVVRTCSEDAVWCDRGTCLSGRDQIREFLARDWARVQDYRLATSLSSYTDFRVGVCLQCEWRDDAGDWYRSDGNELWEFNGGGSVRRREASIDDVVITESDRTFFWPAPGPRPAKHPGVPRPRSPQPNRALDHQTQAQPARQSA